MDPAGSALPAARSVVAAAATDAAAGASLHWVSYPIEVKARFLPVSET